MSLLCLTGHAAIAGPFRNQGLRFGACRRCGRDMIRAAGRWRTVPAGFRLVWRAPADPAAARAIRLPRGWAKASPEARRVKPRQGIATDLAMAAFHLLRWNLAARWRDWRRTLSAPTRVALPILRLQDHG